MHTLFMLLIAANVALPEAKGALVGLAGQDTAQTATLSGVAMPRQFQVQGQDLVLNGMALRKKSIFKVYVAGLYLPSKSSDADQILAQDGPRHLRMQFLRGVGAEKMCEAWNDGLEANTPDASAALKAQFATLCSWMEDVEKGEQFVFTYLPDEGTRVEVRASAKGTLEGKEFADALFKAWIGPKPGPGEGFKRDLLGG
jgi:hypothetical protein